MPLSPLADAENGVSAQDQANNGTTKGARKREQTQPATRDGPPRGKFSPMRISDNIKRKTSKHPPIPVMQQLKNALLSWINILLVLVPVGFALRYAGGVDPIVVFVVNFIAIIPLAGLLSFATEELATYCGENLGGLLNATFGNAVELIVSVIALTQNKVVIVQTSLIGSMLSNLLLVLGMAFFAGGYNRVEQEFHPAVAQISCSLLAVAVASLILPTAYHQFSGEGGGSGRLTPQEIKKNSDTLNSGVDYLSRATAILLLVVYAGYLYFQLSTHKALFNEKSPKSVTRKSSKDLKETNVRRSLVESGAAGGFPAATGGSINQDHIVDSSSIDEEEDEMEEPQLSIFGALLCLLISTVLVAFCSEFMVSGIDSVTGDGGISEVFVGLILIPIVGNAAEHATAVTVAIKDRIPLSISVAVGSSLQIALFVVPVMVVLGWIMDVQGMNLWFDGFQTTALFIAVLLVNYLIQDGKTNYLEGLILMVLYIIIAVAAYFSPEPEKSTVG